MGRIGIALVVSTVVMAGSVVAVNYAYDRRIDKIERVQVATAPSPPDGANYLVIGSDSRRFVDAPDDATEGDVEGQRSDTMMVAHVEPGSRRTLIVSFPRDLWVEIPGHGMDKINAAFDFGPDSVIDTLAHNFGIEINHYVEVDFRSFQEIVEAIGSVPTYFPYPTRDQRANLSIRRPGCARLDGPTSLAYVRARALEYYSTVIDEWVQADAIPDINRIARQQAFIRSLAGLAVAKSLNDPFAALDITDRVVENLKADEDLAREDIDGLVDAFRTVNPDDQTALNMQTFPWVPGPDQDGQSVLYPDDPAWRETAARLGRFESGRTTSAVAPSEVRLRVVDSTGTASRAESALDELAGLGFERAGARIGPDGEASVTEVRYARGALEAGKLVVGYVEPTARLVLDPSLRGADVALVLGTDFVSILRPDGTTTTTSAPATVAPEPTLPAPEPESLTPAPIASEVDLGEPAPRTPPC